jgi:endonuclease G
MGTLQEQLELLRRLNSRIRVEDEVMESMGVPAAPVSDEDALEQESIIMRRERPVLAIKGNTAELVFRDEIDSQIWKARLDRARQPLDRAIRAVGRIDLSGGPLDWVGTGWLVAPDILVTNRHIAREFARRDGNGFTFQMGDEAPIAASVDFLQEIGSDRTLVFRLIRPLHIEEPSGPDIAFFEIDAVSGNDRLAQEIVLARQPALTENAATIGYPAYDSRIPEPELMERIYGKLYNKKRLAPGAVTSIEPKRLLHNCTTLGGNSGSVVVDLDSGEALGLHYSGSFLTTNYAVRADIVAELLEQVRGNRIRGERKAPPSLPTPAPATPQAAVQLRVGDVTIPLTITVSIGEVTAGRAATPAVVTSSGPAVPPLDDDVEGIEGRVEDYRDRGGYRPDFLGVDVPLPQVVRDAADILPIEGGGAANELRYEHYSVVMSRSRRMCFFSAVNISGGQSRKSKRVGWKWDPRLPREQQIMNECYGNPPRFSRGHMTRREDPGWGDDATAKRGNEDSMHVTNVTPQMQAFNSPIWLALEDYALDHARDDAMNISVFTGPYFSAGDPTMYGVRIPVAFWKIIAFIHDQTGKLCATGYEMNQESTLQPEEEFVFGAFTSPQLGVATQVPISAIAARSGIGFGNLADFDPLSTGDALDEGLAARTPLAGTGQIRFA